MKYRLIIIFSFLLTLAKFVVANNTIDVWGSNQDTIKTCFDCHSTLVSQKYIHAPAQESCEDCHSANANEHPKEGVKGFNLADQSPTLCFYCHEEYSQKNIHAPIEGGECLICHNVHSSNNKKLLTASSTNVLCLQCHELEIPKTDFVHSPVKNGACHECHDPHQSNNNTFLKSKGAELCFTCHDDAKKQMQAKNLHMPFEDDCFTCHQPHSTPEKGLLMEKTPTLCFNCHSDIQDLVSASKSVHKVMNDEKSCSNCHSPHASNESAMLVKGGNDLCLSCHSRTYTNESGKTKNIKQTLKSGNVIHAPVEDACSNCHNPHATSSSSLLINSFPAGNYASAKAENFALCFDCHDSNLLLAEKTTDATNFRNGVDNMHFIHVQGDKGKNCTLCHDVHGAKSKFLISEKVPFGNWEMEMNFKVTEFGGSCATGCHAEKEYSRLIDTVSSDSLSTVIKVQQNRYQNYTEEIHAIDSSVIIANMLLEEQYQREQDSLKAIQLLAENKADSISSITESQDSLLASNTSVENNNDNKESTIESDDKMLAKSKAIADSINRVARDKFIQDSLLALQNEENEDSVNIENIEVADNQENIEKEGSVSEVDIVGERLIAEANNPENKDEEIIIEEEKTIVVDTLPIAVNKVVEESEETIIAEVSPESKKEMQVEKLPEDTKELVAQEVALDEKVVPVSEDVEESTDRLQIIDKKKTTEDDIGKLPEFKSIYFAFAEMKVNGDNEIIKNVARWSLANPKRTICLHGHTDSIGASEYNYFLSLKRIESVKQALISLGVNKSVIKLKGHGESKPIAPNNTPQGRALNRRVEFIIVENE